MDVAYLPGTDDIAADALSMSPIFSISLGLSFKELEHEYHSSGDAFAFRTYITGM